jgi:hypothetical protein
MLETRFAAQRRSKRVFAAFMAVLAITVAPSLGVLAAGITASLEPSPPPVMREAVDPRGRFVIDFPENWAVHWVGDRAFRLSGGVRDALVGIGPAGADGRRVNVIVDVRVLPSPMAPETAAKYAETGLRRLTAYQSLQAGPAAVGGVPAYHRLFTHVEQGARLFEVQMYVTQGRQFFVLSGTTRTDRAQIPHDLPLLLQIIGTFRLLPQHQE